MKTTLENIMQAFISGGWANQSGGDVESPVGHYAIVEIESNRKEMREAFEDDFDGEELMVLDSLGTGTYLETEDSNGFVFVDGPHPMSWAVTWFGTQETEYAAWDDVE